MTTADVSKTLNSRPYASKSAADAPVVRRRASSTQQPSWFSGLRSRISQLSMPEWLSQLGIGNSQHTDAHSGSSTSTSTPTSNKVLSPVTEDECGVEYVNESYIFPTRYSSRTVDNFLDSTAISLSNKHEEDESFDWGWTMDSSLWSGDGSISDTLVVQHFGPLKNLITCCQHPGQGHHFTPMSVAHPTWCDKCGDFMWGFLTHAVKCDTCNYTCHAKCKSLVTLDCKTAESSINSTVERSTVAQIYPDLQSLCEPNPSAQDDNTSALPTQENTESSQEKFSGSVQIHMNFTRPINVVAGETPPSFLDVVNSSGTVTTKSLRTITTFFLPRNTVKTVNISSQMTTREMIVVLLRKFKVADNPRKFALYERIFGELGEASSECRLLRVADEAFPLRIARAWQESGECRQLVLQENDTGDILWEMFEVPELENFLRILVDEEKQYSFRIRQKYDAYRYYLNEHLRNRGYFTTSECIEGTSPSAPNLSEFDPEDENFTGTRDKRRAFPPYGSSQVIGTDEFTSIHV